MLCCKIIKSPNNLKLKVRTEFPYVWGAIAIPIYRVLPYPVIGSPREETGVYTPTVPRVRVLVPFITRYGSTLYIGIA